MTAPITPRYRDPNWRYVPAKDTNIRKTFERAAAAAAVAPPDRGAAVVISPLVNVSPLAARILLQRFARRQA